jgi:hypothetical protein
MGSFRNQDRRTTIDFNYIDSYIDFGLPEVLDIGPGRGANPSQTAHIVKVVVRTFSIRVRQRSRSGRPTHFGKTTWTPAQLSG